MAGLTTAEAAARLAAEGPNRLEEQARRTPVHMLADQLKNPFVLLLGAAAVLAFALGERIDAAAIGTIVVLNAIVGTVQEWRAERALAALRSMTAPRATVVRDGQAQVLPAEELVRGDVLLLEAGDVVAADARLLEANQLEAVEAPLTGESLPVHKSAEPVVADTPLAERSDTVFAGTSVATGSGRAEIVATGMRTELGRIAGMLTTAERAPTPLQVQLARISRALLVLCLGIVAIVVALGVLRSDPWLDVLLLAVALAVAAVPEGLPAVVTIALAVGVQRMAARHVLVRRLPAVETLGCTTVICTDKTGTLTTGKMRVREVWAPAGDRRMLEIAAACSNAEIREDGTGVGDPTEVALLLKAREHGIERADLEARWPRVAENAFDSVRKRMSVARDVDGQTRLYVKGALSSLAPLARNDATVARQVEEDWADRGLRVLAVAEGRGTEEEDLELLGLVGIADPPRASAIAAIEAAHAAGIRTMMLTGDHATTARAIARELGVDDVYARVTPEDKLRVVRELSGQGEIVAMTGDGVNDAPAIREAHVGIAMGITGTEVTREAASVVLADDHFASIVEGIREGRAIHENIRKTVVYLVAGNAAELAVVLLVAIVGLPAALLPIHLLWINLVTDGLPALALVVDPPDRNAMTEPPRDPAEPMLGRREWGVVAASAALEASAVLAVYVWAVGATDPQTARTMAFSTLVCSELLRVVAFRSRRLVLPEVGVFSNIPLVAVMLLSLVVQVGLTEIAPAARVFYLVPLEPLQWALVGVAAFFPVSVLEITKLIRRVVR